MKNYLNFESELKNLEDELEKLKDPYNQDGLSEVNTVKISKVEEEINQKLNDYYYKDLSSIELFHVSQKEGKIIISYIRI